MEPHVSSEAHIGHRSQACAGHRDGQAIPGPGPSRADPTNIQIRAQLLATVVCTVAHRQCSALAEVDPPLSPNKWYSQGSDTPVSYSILQRCLLEEQTVQPQSPGFAKH